MKNNFCFQFASEKGEIFADSGLINIEEARELWAENYPEAIELIQEGIGVNMYLWCNMEHEEDFRETVLHIDNDYTTDGEFIYPPKPEPIRKTF